MRPKRRQVETYSQRTAWSESDDAAVREIVEELAGLPTSVTTPTNWPSASIFGRAAHPVGGLEGDQTTLERQRGVIVGLPSACSTSLTIPKVKESGGLPARDRHRRMVGRRHPGRCWNRCGKRLRGLVIRVHQARRTEDRSHRLRRRVPRRRRRGALRAGPPAPTGNASSPKCDYFRKPPARQPCARSSRPVSPNLGRPGIAWRLCWRTAAPGPTKSYGGSLRCQRSGGRFIRSSSVPDRHAVNERFGFPAEINATAQQSDFIGPAVDYLTRNGAMDVDSSTTRRSPGIRHHRPRPGSRWITSAAPQDGDRRHRRHLPTT